MASDEKLWRRRGGCECAALNCTNGFYRTDCKGKSFFTFPAEDERCKVWIQNSQRLDLIGKSAQQLNASSYSLCSAHFEGSQFNVPSERKRLVWNAVPTLFKEPNSQLLASRKGTPAKKRTATQIPKKKRCTMSDLEQLTREPDHTVDKSGLQASMRTSDDQEKTCESSAPQCRSSPSIIKETVFAYNKEPDTWVNVLLNKEVYTGWCMVKDKLSLAAPNDVAAFLLSFYKEQAGASINCSACGSPLSHLCTVCLQQQHLQQHLNQQQRQQHEENPKLQQQQPLHKQPLQLPQWQNGKPFHEEHGHAHSSGKRELLAVGVVKTEKCSNDDCEVSGREEISGEDSTLVDVKTENCSHDDCENADESVRDTEMISGEDSKLVDVATPTEEMPSDDAEVHLKQEPQGKYSCEERCKEKVETASTLVSTLTQTRIHTKHIRRRIKAKNVKAGKIKAKKARVYRCRQCQKTFPTFEERKVHTKTDHKKESKFQCDECGITLSCRSSLGIHKRLHTQHKPHACDVCHRAFTQSSSLRQHKLVHFDHRPHQCITCTKTFRSRLCLKTHQLVHTKEKCHTCLYCDKGFGQKYNLKRHLYLHSGQKPYVCDICHKAFNQSTHLHLHKKVHANPNKRVRRGRPKKEQNCFPTGQNCPVCGKHFQHIANLHRHIIIHTGQKPYMCHVCGKRFNSSSNLKAHTQIHKKVIHSLKITAEPDNFRQEPPSLDRQEPKV